MYPTLTTTVKMTVKTLVTIRRIRKYILISPTELVCFNSQYKAFVRQGVSKDHFSSLFSEIGACRSYPLTSGYFVN